MLALAMIQLESLISGLSDPLTNSLMKSDPMCSLNGKVEPSDTSMRTFLSLAHDGLGKGIPAKLAGTCIGYDITKSGNAFL